MDTNNNNHHHHHLIDGDPSPPLIFDDHPDHHLLLDDNDSLNLSDLVQFCEDEDEDCTSSDAENQPQQPTTIISGGGGVKGSISNPRIKCINPDPHISSQFYTFTQESHTLMIKCIQEARLATPDEIRVATPATVLSSWKSVWKDRNEDTAYLTAWKRIQDKLNVHKDESGNEFLCFKNNMNNQFVSHVGLWQDIVMSFHGDSDLKHLGARETIERIKNVWTVGAKFYGIPESFIRVCVASCPVCTGPASRGSAMRSSKRRRFEYTESIEVPAKEVPSKLQELATKHKVVLCIRQKYIRYKPFMAEVKDYACHRAGEPTSASFSGPAAKRSRVMKRDSYASKRCGCGFRIRAIVPITNYNEKEKTFVYQEEGVAVFKLYAVHSGHEPGPLDGNARIMHRVVGQKGSFLMDQDIVYGMSDEVENEVYFGFVEKDDGDLQHLVLQKEDEDLQQLVLQKDNGDLQHLVLQQVKELRNEVGLLEGKIAKISPELLGSVSQELFDILNKVKGVGDCGSKSTGLLSDKMQSDDILVGENNLPDWSDDHHHPRIYGNGKDTILIEDDEDSFERTLKDVDSWNQIRADVTSEKDFNCEDSKLIKPLVHDEPIETDVVCLDGIQVDSFHPDNPKWYDSPCGLDSGTDCGDSGFRNGEIV